LRVIAHAFDGSDFDRVERTSVAQAHVSQRERCTAWARLPRRSPSRNEGAVQIWVAPPLARRLVGGVDG
jgi:hypothetical protein